MKKRRKILILPILIILMGLTACIGKESDVKTAVVPLDATQNELSGKYKNSADGNIWQFNANGSLLISSEGGGTGEYEVKYKDGSMYLTNGDGATIEFFYLEKEDGSVEITINGKNADTSVLKPE